MRLASGIPVPLANLPTENALISDARDSLSTITSEIGWPAVEACCSRG